MPGVTPSMVGALNALPDVLSSRTSVDSASCCSHAVSCLDPSSLTTTCASHSPCRPAGTRTSVSVFILGAATGINWDQLKLVFVVDGGGGVKGAQSNDWKTPQPGELLSLTLTPSWGGGCFLVCKGACCAPLGWGGFPGLDLCSSSCVTLLLFFLSGLPTSRQHGHRPPHAAVWLPEAFVHQRLLVTTLGPDGNIWSLSSLQPEPLR